MSQQPSSASPPMFATLADWWAPLGLAVTFIGFVLIGGKKLRQMEEHEIALDEARAERKIIHGKIDRLLDAVNLLAKSGTRTEAECEALRRDVDRLFKEVP